MRRMRERLRAFTVAAAALGLAGFVAAQEPPASQESDLKGCGACHKERVESFFRVAHGRNSMKCEECHEDAKLDLTPEGKLRKLPEYKKQKPEEFVAKCRSCHSAGTQAYWPGSVHERRDLTCLNCHDPHHKDVSTGQLLMKPVFDLCTTCHPQRKAQLFRSGHMPMREGKVTCVSCHNPHGTVNKGLLVTRSVNETCYRCHAEKRGPFLWEHAPVRENCLTCHDAHGTMHDNMLKMKPPALCQQCHVSSRHPSQPHAAGERFSFSQGCMNCHPTIHGSSHPSGVRFMR